MSTQSPSTTNVSDVPSAPTSADVPSVSLSAPASDAHPLDRLFAPRSIAIVGASDRSGWSLATFGNLTRSGYGGGLHLVNRRGGTVHDRPAATSLTALGEPVDLAYVLTGPDSIPDVLTDARAAAVDNLAVIAAGYGEMGEVGRQREREMVTLARRQGQRILGPNNLGFINADANVMCWSQMMPWPLLRGGVGMMSQSGALGIFILNHFEARDVGISHLVTLGNEAMITVAEGIDYLIAQESTRVIALYLESVRHPEAFLDAADRALAAGKPIVAYKAGRGELGARVAAAHTGSIAGDDAVIDTVFRQHGIIRVDTLEDLVTTCGLLEAHAPLPGGRTAFVTGSGAMCSVISDTAEACGLDLPAFAPETVAELREKGLPEFATPQNPLDTTGYVVIDTNLLPNCEEVVSRDPGIDILVVNGSAPPDPERAVMYARSADRRQAMVAASPVPVVLMDFLPSDRTPFAREWRREHGVPHVVDSFTRGIPALAKAVWWSELHRAAAAASEHGAEHVADGVRVEGDATGTWSEHQASRLLADHGVPVVPSEVATTPEEAVAAAERLGYPVALKVVSVQISHKTDVGGVVLGCADAAAVRAAHEGITERVRTARPDATVEGVLVSPMRTGGTELLVGIIRDPVWGLTLAVGLGGVWVEVLRDSALRVLPVDRAEIRAMLGELRGAGLLTGARGAEPADLDEVVRVIDTVARLAVGLGDRLAELEINPLWVSGARVEALDALVRWADPADNADHH